MVALRPAADVDVAALRMIATAAYERYVPRIGRPPAPMTADYAHAVRSGQAWVAVEHGEIVGFAILIAQAGHLLLENIAEDTGHAIHQERPEQITNAVLHVVEHVQQR